MTRKKKHKLTKEELQHIQLTFTAYREFSGSDIAETGKSSLAQGNLPDPPVYEEECDE